MEPAEQGLFSGVEDLSKMLDSMRRINSLINQGKSELDAKGRTMLTWELNDKGRKALDDNTTHPPVNADIALDAKPSKIGAEEEPPLCPYKMALADIQLATDKLTRMVENRPSIKDRPLKLATLTKLGGIVSEDIKTVLDAIISDLEAA